MSTPDATDTTSEPDDGRQTEHWTYIGKRPGDGYPHGFLDPAGKERYFSGKVMPNPGIGARYAVSVLHRDDGEGGDRVSAYIETARYIGMHDSRDEIAAWRFEHMAAEAQRQQEAAAKRLAKENSNIGALTLDEVRALLRRQPSMIRRGTIAALNEWFLR